MRPRPAQSVLGLMAPFWCRNFFQSGTGTLRASRSLVGNFYTRSKSTPRKRTLTSVRLRYAGPKTKLPARTGPASLIGPKTGLKVEAFTPPQEIIGAVEKIVAAAQIEVGSVEYLIDDRDGTVVYYDINALSNFVANAPQILGFDPHVRLVDYLEQEKERA